MKTISVTDEEYEFLKSLSHELNTQDNRLTANPYYYTVKTVRKMAAPEGYDIGEAQYIDSYYNVYETREAALEALRSGEYGVVADPEDYIDDNFTEFGTYEIYQHENVFLTLKGYEDHMRLNKHNYPNDATSYVNYANRNPEMTKLINILRKIGNE